MLQIDAPPDGTLGEQIDSIYHGDYPNASETYLFPGEARVAGNSSIIYNTEDLTYSNSLAGGFDDLDFYGDLPIVLRNGELIVYSNRFLETDRFQPSQQPASLKINADTIFTFTDAINASAGKASISVDKIAIDLLTSDTPGQAVDPNDLSFTPDAAALISQPGSSEPAGDQLFLLSRNHLSIFRWSVREYLAIHCTTPI